MVLTYRDYAMNDIHDNSALATLDVQGLAALLRKSVQTVARDVSRRPHCLPPPCTPIGVKPVLWLTADVAGWLRAVRDGRLRALGEQIERLDRLHHRSDLGRGRPSKAEQRRRRRLCDAAKAAREAGHGAS